MGLNGWRLKDVSKDVSNAGAPSSDKKTTRLALRPNKRYGVVSEAPADDVTLYGCMDVWMYGCMDVWMYV